MRKCENKWENKLSLLSIDNFEINKFKSTFESINHWMYFHIISLPMWSTNFLKLTIGHILLINSIPLTTFLISIVFCQTMLKWPTLPPEQLSPEELIFWGIVMLPEQLSPEELSFGNYLLLGQSSLWSIYRRSNWRVYFQNLINPLLVKIEFLTSLYSIPLELVTEWNLDPDNSRKYIFVNLNFVFP